MITSIAEDNALIAGLGFNAYRFSIEWARVEPAPGEFSIAQLDHYRRMLEVWPSAGARRSCHVTSFYIGSQVSGARRMGVGRGRGVIRTLLRTRCEPLGRSDRYCLHDQRNQSVCATQAVRVPAERRRYPSRAMASSGRALDGRRNRNVFEFSLLRAQLFARSLTERASAGNSGAARRAR